MSEKNEEKLLKNTNRKRPTSREEKIVESILEDMHYRGHKGYKPRWSYLKMSWHDLQKFVVKK